MMSITSLMFLIYVVAAATAVDDDNGNNNKKISKNVEQQECYSDHYKENLQIIIQRELGTNNNSTGDFDIAIKDGQVCVYMNDNVDERKSGISQQRPMQDDNNNYCDNPSTCIQLNQGSGDDEIGDFSIDIS
jgi:hypothetical protein